MPQERSFRRTKYLYLHNFAFAEIHNQVSNSKQVSLLLGEARDASYFKSP